MIPDYQSLMRPVLECARNEPRKISDVVEEISDRLGLTDEERQQMLPSGEADNHNQPGALGAVPI
jgi:restriction system protein